MVYTASGRGVGSLEILRHGCNEIIEKEVSQKPFVFHPSIDLDT